MTADNKFLEVKVANGGIKFAFGNGEVIRFDPTSCSADIRAQAERHGFNQKIRDAAAGYSKTRDYAGAIGEMRAVIESLQSGSWNRAGGAGAAAIADLIAAIASVRNAPLDKVAKAVEGATAEQRASWAKNAKVALAIAEIRAQRAREAVKSTTDTEDDGLPDLSEGEGE